MCRITSMQHANFAQQVLYLKAAIMQENSREVSEWLKEHAWKVCIPKGIEGSNPFLSAILAINDKPLKKGLFYGERKDMNPSKGSTKLSGTILHA